TRRNVIPVMLPGFVFPNLPHEINDLRRHQACEYHHGQYFTAMIDWIVGNLVHEETKSAQSAREQAVRERRQAAQAATERKLREQAEEERRKREKEQADRLTLERQEAERRTRQQTEHLSPEGRNARALFRG